MFLNVRPCVRHTEKRSYFSHKTNVTARFQERGEQTNVLPFEIDFQNLGRVKILDENKELFDLQTGALAENFGAVSRNISENNPNTCRYHIE